jgi:hypothetical protein
MRRTLIGYESESINVLGPPLFPMAVAWAGQIRFAMTVMRWPLPAAIVFAAGFELSTAYVARLDWRSRAAGDSALLFRGATWGFAAGAAVMNYWHAAGPHFAPTGEAVSYGLMSVTGVVLWELLSTYRHRTALRAEGKLPAARPRFGLARWIWFGSLTRLAWLLTLRDGYATTELAWRAALGAVDLYGSARAARKAVRTGRPVPRPEPLAADERDEDNTDPRDSRDDEQYVEARDDDSDVTVRYTRDGGTRDERRDVVPADLRSADPDRVGRDVVEGDPEQDPVSRGGAPTDRLDDERDDPDTYHPAPEAQAGAGADPQDSVGRTGVGARMLAYARERLAQGTAISGADLDRQFGTRDYGRKVLRRLAAGGDGRQ